MSELAMREHASLTIAEDPAADLIAWAQAAQQAHLIAVQLAETSFVPKSMQHMPGEVTGAILAGRELGLSPMASLRSIDIIDGTPSMRALALRGLVEHHGHEVWVEESTEHRAIVCGKRRRTFNPLAGGAVREHVERSVWTMDRAKKAGLAGKKNWQAHPTAMLVARATAEVCRLIAADVLIGMPYATEELADGAEVGLQGSDPQPSSARSPGAATVPPRRARRATPPAALVDLAEVEPELSTEPTQPADPLAPPAVTPTDVAPRPVERAGWPEPATPAEADPDTDEVMITRPQSSKLHATFNGLDIRERARRLSVTSQIVGRDLTSSADLTKREATYLIDTLERGWPPADDDQAEVIDYDDDNYDNGYRPVQVVDPGGLL